MPVYRKRKSGRGKGKTYRINRLDRDDQLGTVRAKDFNKDRDAHVRKFTVARDAQATEANKARDEFYAGLNGKMSPAEKKRHEARKRRIKRRHDMGYFY